MLKTAMLFPGPKLRRRALEDGHTRPGAGFANRCSITQVGVHRVVYYEMSRAAVAGASQTVQPSRAPPVVARRQFENNNVKRDGGAPPFCRHYRSLKYSLLVKKPRHPSRHICNAEDVSSSYAEVVDSTTTLFPELDNYDEASHGNGYWRPASLTQSTNGSDGPSTSSSPTTLHRSRTVLTSVNRLRSNTQSPKPSTTSALVKATTFVPTDAPPAPASPTHSEDTLSSSVKLWALAMLSVAYIHQSATGFAIPAMLPLLSSELQLSDLQGAFLTSGYSYLYAVALIPVGLLADKVPRPALLAVGLALWSALTCKMSVATNFCELMVTRVGFAAAQATQNPISFSLIPDLFPANKSTAMAVYNCAIYVGRALSFAAAMLAQHLGLDHHEAVQYGLHLVPLDQLDLHTMSVVYTRGEMAVVSPIYDYTFDELHTATEAAASMAEPSPWRRMLWWLGLPGLAISALMLLTVVEPRNVTPAAGDGKLQAHTNLWQSATARLRHALGRDSPSIPPVMGLTSPRDSTASVNGLWQGIQKLLKMPSFQAVTAAAALNDIGNYALVAWQAVFYERIFHMDAGSYGPVLAVVVPIGGILGGVGGGFIADKLEHKGGRAWMTVGASFLAAPAMAASLLSSTAHDSFAFLLVAFALSEAWRAPGAVMIRGIAPPGSGSSASAAYLCVRNLIGGMGPLAVAQLAGSFGLQRALLLIPACYVLSAAMFAVAEVEVAQEHSRRALAAADAQQN